MPLNSLWKTCTQNTKWDLYKCHPNPRCPLWKWEFRAYVGAFITVLAEMTHDWIPWVLLIYFSTRLWTMPGWGLRKLSNKNSVMQARLHLGRRLWRPGSVLCATVKTPSNHPLIFGVCDHVSPYCSSISLFFSAGRIKEKSLPIDRSAMVYPLGSPLTVYLTLWYSLITLKSVCLLQRSPERVEKI